MSKCLLFVMICLTTLNCYSEKKKDYLLTDKAVFKKNKKAQSVRITVKLKDVAPHSWHVDVVVKPVGWLGTFRQSRVTGRWFSGTHTVHMMGNVFP